MRVAIQLHFAFTNRQGRMPGLRARRRAQKLGVRPPKLHTLAVLARSEYWIAARRGISGPPMFEVAGVAKKRDAKN